MTEDRMLEQIRILDIHERPRHSTVFSKAVHGSCPDPRVG